MLENGVSVSGLTRFASARQKFCFLETIQLFSVRGRLHCPVLDGP